MITMSREFWQNRFETFLRGATEAELEAAARVCAPDARKYLLRRRHGATCWAELPAVYAEDILQLIRKNFPDADLSWTDGKSDLERDFEARLQRMRGKFDYDYTFGHRR